MCGPTPSRPTPLKMVTMTRFDCMVGTSGGMRQTVAQALHHCRYRTAFGKRLVEQPLMQNVRIGNPTA
jgi:putative acyl-CoA dehydrogenase